MGATYTRQSSAGIVDGGVIEASDINNELDQLLAAFVAASGHTHDGTAAEGGPITKLLGTSITIGDASSGTDIAVTFDGESADGVLTWMEDEDYFKFSDEVLMNSTEKLLFGDTGTYIHQSADGVLDLVSDTELELNATTIDINGAIDVSGASQLSGAVTVGVDGTGLDVKFFGASAGAYGLYDQSENAFEVRGATAAGAGLLKLTTGELTVVDADKLGRIDFQAPLESDGTDAILIGASIWAEADDTFSSSVNNTDLVFALGKSEAAAEKFRFTADNEIGIAGANYGTDGQVLTSGGAGAAVAWEDAGGTTITALNNATNNELVTIGSTTTELDAEANLTFTGSALTCIGTITVGVDDTGHDVKFFGATASSYALWDESADSLLLNAATLDLNGTADGLILDVNGNTTISSPTDDQIDFEIAGADDFTMTANTFTILSGSTIAIAAGGAITNAGSMAPDITSTGKALVFGF